MLIFMEVFVHSIEKEFCRKEVCMSGQRGSRKVAQMSAMTKEQDAPQRLMTPWSMHVSLFRCYCFCGLSKGQYCNIIRKKVQRPTVLITVTLPKELKPAIRTKCRRLLSKGIGLHDNAQVHTIDTLHKFRFEVLQHTLATIMILPHEARPFWSPERSPTRINMSDSGAFVTHRLTAKKALLGEYESLLTKNEVIMLKNDAFSFLLKVIKTNPAARVQIFFKSFS